MILPKKKLWSNWKYSLLSNDDPINSLFKVLLGSKIFFVRDSFVLLKKREWRCKDQGRKFGNCDPKYEVKTKQIDSRRIIERW